MKKIIFLWAVLVGGLAAAQTNLPVVATPPAPTNGAVARSLTEIHSDTGDFDLNARQAVYCGHVRVDDPEMKLTCERLVVFFPPAGERVNHIEAQTNVVIHFTDNHGQSTRATGALAVYRYAVQAGATNETVTLTGEPQVESAQGTLAGSEIVWDRTTGHLNTKNPRIIFQQDLKNNTGTNAAPLKLF